MTETTDPAANPAGALVVGYDGSAPAQAALDWGMAEAALRGVPVVLLHAVMPPTPTSALGYAVPVDLGAVDDLQSAAGEVLQQAAQEAAERTPGVEVEALVQVGSPTAVLLEASRDADLVVVGSRGHGGFRGLILGSVGVQTATHADCPVVIVRGVPEKPDGPVLVGVDGSELARAALGFGFDYASRHGLPLLAVHAWQVPPYDTLAMPGAVPIDALTEVEDDELRLTAESMAGYRESYPDVEVEQRVVEGPAAKILVDAAADASLVVVGSHGRGEFLSALLGSVSHAVIHKVDCPVAVVRPAHVGEDDT